MRIAVELGYVELPEGIMVDLAHVNSLPNSKAVIICTGGSIGNENFRTMFDPRLGPEYDGLAGMPFSDQDGSGELAAMKVGAALGSAAGYMVDDGGAIVTPARMGCQYGYGNGFDEKPWYAQNLAFARALEARINAVEPEHTITRVSSQGSASGKTVPVLLRHSQLAAEPRFIPSPAPVHVAVAAMLLSRA